MMGETKLAMNALVQKSEIIAEKQTRRGEWLTIGYGAVVDQAVLTVIALLLRGAGF